MNYTGPWYKQCPYCGSRKVRQDSHTYVDAGIHYREWEDSAQCLTCGGTWLDYEVQIPACPVCGVHHSGDIGPEGTPYQRADGSLHDEALLICHHCGTHTDQTTGEIITRFSKENANERNESPDG